MLILFFFICIAIDFSSPSSCSLFQAVYVNCTHDVYSCFCIFCISIWGRILRCVAKGDCAARWPKCPDWCFLPWWMAGWASRKSEVGFPVCSTSQSPLQGDTKGDTYVTKMIPSPSTTYLRLQPLLSRLLRNQRPEASFSSSPCPQLRWFCFLPALSFSGNLSLRIQLLTSFVIWAFKMDVTYSTHRITVRCKTTLQWVAKGSNSNIKPKQKHWNTTKCNCIFVTKISGLVQLFFSEQPKTQAYCSHVSFAFMAYWSRSETGKKELKALPCL